MRIHILLQQFNELNVIFYKLILDTFLDVLFANNLDCNLSLVLAFCKKSVKCYKKWYNNKNVFHLEV